MKFLTCCEGGNCRSVSLAMLLRLEFGQRDVLVCGLSYTSEETLKMLCEWAETIIVVGESRLTEKVPWEHRNKIVLVDVGYDKWRNPFDPELVGLLRYVVQYWMDKGEVTNASARPVVERADG